MKTKNSILVFVLALGSLSFGQTNVISLKSHSGDLAELAKEKDNFGEMSMPRFYVDSVIFIKPGVLVESKHSDDYNYYHNPTQKSEQFYDTIIDPSVTETLTYTLRKRYSTNVVFVGFKEKKVENVNPYFEGMKKNGANTILLLFELLIFLGFIRRYRLEHVK